MHGRLTLEMEVFDLELVLESRSRTLGLITDHSGSEEEQHDTLAIPDSDLLHKGSNMVATHM